MCFFSIDVDWDRVLLAGLEITEILILLLGTRYIPSRRQETVPSESTILMVGERAVDSKSDI